MNRGDRVVVPVLALEYVEGGNTMWVQGANGTVLRIKTKGTFTSKSCSLEHPHGDAIISESIEMCVPPETTSDTLDEDDLTEWSKTP